MSLDRTRILQQYQPVPFNAVKSLRFDQCCGSFRAEYAARKSEAEEKRRADQAAKAEAKAAAQEQISKVSKHPKSSTHPIGIPWISREGFVHARCHMIRILVH